MHSIKIEEKKPIIISRGRSKKIRIKKINKSKPIIIVLTLIIFIQFLFLVYLFNFHKFNSGSDSKFDNKNIEDISLSDEKKFNENIKQKYVFHQKLLCENELMLNNTSIEEKIKKVKASIKDISYDMFVYQKEDSVSNGIAENGNYERKHSEEILSALLYYANKKNIKKNDIYVLDIGGNIGWYTLSLGKAGYNIISFEPSKINYYILLKSYCLNKDINITVINKGLDAVEKNDANLYHSDGNQGNAMLVRDFKQSFIEEKITLTKLDNYIDYLSSKNVAVMKLDIEGSEGKAIEGGIELITKYHVPFIFMELINHLLKLKGTDLKSFLEIFENNGYKISKKGFFSKQYCSINDVIKEEKTNVYIVYTKFLE